MTFLAPALLAGLLGLGLPFIAHFLGRQPPRTVRFGAVRFLAGSREAVTHRRMLHDIPLMLLRMAVIALLAFILARPATTNPAALAVVAEPHDAMIMLDTSRSMGLRVGGQTLLQAGANRARQLVDGLPPGSTVGFVASDPTSLRVEVGSDAERIHAVLRSMLDQGQPKPGAWVLRDALPIAVSLLQQRRQDQRKQVVYAIGDGTAGGLGSLPRTAEGGILIIPVPAVDDLTVPDHLGIDAVDWAPAPELDPQAIRVQAMVHHYAPAPARTTGGRPRSVAVALRVEDREVARTTVDIPPGERVPVEFTHTLLDGEGPVPATVELVDLRDDPLPSDDRRHLWLSATDTVELVIVNGDPSELRAHDEVYFLTTALTAGGADRNLSIHSVAPDQLENRIREGGQAALDDIDVLVLANVRAPTEDVTPMIVEATRRGMGLLIAVGDRVEARPYNDRLGSVLPLLLREAVTVGTAPGRTEARVEGLAPPNLNHPAFRGLSGELGLSGTRARKIFLLEPDPARRGDVALAFTNGAPALMTRADQGGRVALLTTTIDRDWSDLPLRPGFVALVERLILWLGGGRGSLQGSQILVGEPRTFRSESPVTVSAPGDVSHSLAPSPDGTTVFEATYEPGHYRLERPETDAKSEVFAVAVDPSESDLQPVSVDEKSDAPTTEVERVVTWEPRWRMLVPLLVLLVAAETVVRWLGRRP